MKKYKFYRLLGTCENKRCPKYSRKKIQVRLRQMKDVGFVKYRNTERDPRLAITG